jgi:hypothetical protein
MTSLRRVINVPARGTEKASSTPSTASGRQRRRFSSQAASRFRRPTRCGRKLNRAIDERFVPQRGHIARTFRDLILGLADVARKSRSRSPWVRCSIERLSSGFARGQVEDSRAALKPDGAGSAAREPRREPKRHWIYRQAVAPLRGDEDRAA